MKIGQLSDFTQKELAHPTFTIVDKAVPEETYLVLGSLSVPHEDTAIVDSVNHYVNSKNVKPVLTQALKARYPELVDPTFAYVSWNDRNLQ